MPFDVINKAGVPKIDLFNREAFVNNLGVMYALMIASEDLLDFAIAHTKDSELLDYFKSHIEEERGHAEWLKEDLRHLGIEASPSFMGAACAGTQFYLIRYVHPAALLGYMAVLEGFPMSLDVVEQLEQAHGKEAVRTLRYHAENDVDHGNDLREMIEKLPQHKQLIIDSAVQTLNYLRSALACEGV